MARAYYRVLEEEVSFVEALSQLAKTVEALLPDFVGTPFSPPIRPLAEDLPASVGEVLRRFAAKWNLPAREVKRNQGLAVRHLWQVLSEHNSEFDDGGPRLSSFVLDLDSGDRSPPWIFPKPVPVIEYDPLWQSSESLLEKADDAARLVRESILAQGECMAEAARGGGPWTKVPQRHYSTEELTRLAHRLFWAVFPEDGRVRTWKEVARLALADERSVRETVKSWATQLEVPLPARHRGRRKASGK